MSRMVFCKILNAQADSLPEPPYPGEIGERIYNEISAQGWQQWLERLTAIINENRLNTADPGSLDLIEKHMMGFLFNEGDYGQMPSGFVPQGQKK